MRRLYALVLVLALLPAVALGQTTRISTSATLPAACTVGSIYVKTGASPGLYVCLALNTWTGPLVTAAAAIADADKGDITTSASGATWTIDNAAVTLAKQANLAEATIQGRAAGAGAGVPTALTATQVRTITDVPTNAEAILDALIDAKGDLIAGSAADTPARLAVGSNTQVLTADSGEATGMKWAPVVATLADADFGDVTVSSSGTVFTIDNDAVTYAKIQDVTATDRLLGRDTASSGIIEELTVGGGVEFTGSAGIQRSALTGEVTASAGSNSTTIANNAVVTARILDANVTNAKLADMNALTVKVRAANSTGVPSDVALTDGHTAKRVGTAVVSATYGPDPPTVLGPGVAQTYTTPAGIYRLWVRGCGAGGAGGGGDQGAATSGAGAGGGGGGYFERVVSTIPAATFTYTVGTGGTVGAAGNASGNAGSTATVWDSGGTPATGNVGNGGGSMATGTALAASTQGSGGTATGGDVNISGQAGTQGIRWALAQFYEGAGGSSQLGRGGPFQSSGAGIAGSGYCSGGGGGSAFGASADVTGGAGADGVILVMEYN